MFLTNCRSISLYYTHIDIKLKQFPALATMCGLECRRVQPIELEIVLTGSIPNKHFGEFKMLFTFRTISPVTTLFMTFFFMQTTECIFTVIAGTYIENVRNAGTGCVGGVANGSIAAVGSHEGTLFPAETTIGA